MWFRHNKTKNLFFDWLQVEFATINTTIKMHKSISHTSVDQWMTSRKMCWKQVDARNCWIYIQRVCWFVSVYFCWLRISKLLLSPNRQKMSQHKKCVFILFSLHCWLHMLNSCVCAHAGCIRPVTETFQSECVSVCVSEWVMIICGSVCVCLCVCVCVCPSQPDAMDVRPLGCRPIKAYPWRHEHVHTEICDVTYSTWVDTHILVCVDTRACVCTHTHTHARTHTHTPADEEMGPQW